MTAMKEEASVRETAAAGATKKKNKKKKKASSEKDAAKNKRVVSNEEEAAPAVKPNGEMHPKVDGADAENIDTSEMDGGDDSEDECNVDDIACCLCKCAVDFSDESFFLPPSSTSAATVASPSDSKKNEEGVSKKIDPVDKDDSSLGANDDLPLEGAASLGDNDKVYLEAEETENNVGDSSGSEVAKDARAKSPTKPSEKDAKGANETPLQTGCHSNIKSANGTSSDDMIKKEESDEEESAKPLFQLPRRFYDPGNALILCDGPAHASRRRASNGQSQYKCERAYHQRCHFIPVFSLPRGPWRCLICRYRDEEYLKRKAGKGRKGHAQNKGSKGVVQSTDDKIASSLSDDELNAIFLCPANGPNNDSTDSGEKPSASAATESAVPIDIVSTELKFEQISAPLKAKTLHAELTTRAEAFIKTTLSNIRSSEHSIRAFTETSKARKLLAERMENMDGRLPQELIQCVLRIALAKMKIKDFIDSIQETIKRRPFHGHMFRAIYDEDAECIDVASELMQWYLSQQPADHDNTLGSCGSSMLLKYIFPEGNIRRRRIEPRTGEAGAETDASSHASDSSGITLDDLKCSCCHDGHASYDNDLLLCDGEGCYRAFHMHCLEPKLSPEDLAAEDNDNWFCPLCTAHAMLVHYTQREYLGDEWEEHVRSNAQTEQKENESQNHYHEWETAQDVFPEASSEVGVAQKLKEGVHDEETSEFLSDTFGISTSSRQVIGHSALFEDDDEEEEENDEDFVLGAQKKDVSDDESSVEDMDEEEKLANEKIDADELDALSVGSMSESSSIVMDADKSGLSKRLRRSKRKIFNLHDEKHGYSSSDSDESRSRSPVRDVGKLDTANIVCGKRNRTKVDYRK